MHNQSYEPSFDFQPDSFDQPHPSDNEYQIQNREVPAAIPSDHYIGNVNGRGQDDRKLRNGKNKKQLGYGEENNGYQVTFKKQNNKFKSLRSTNEVKANLFTKQQFNNNEANIIKNRSSRTKQINLPNNPQSEHNNDRILNTIQISHTVQQLFTNILNPPIIVPLSMLEYSLQSLLQSDQIISQVAQLKIQTLLNFINLKNLRKKRNSVNINLAIMVIQMEIQVDDDNGNNGNLDNKQTRKSNDKGKNNSSNINNSKKAIANKKEFTQADRKKMEILSLLKIQLDKKIFIEALKFQRLRNFCDKVLREVAQDQKNANQEQDEMQAQQQNNANGQQQQQQHNEFINNTKSPPATSPTPNYSPTHNNPCLSVPSSSAYYQQSRLTVFTQILGSLLNTRVFYPCFKIIKNNNKKNTRIFIESDQLDKYIVPAHQNNKNYEQQQQYHNQNDDGGEYEQVDKDPVIAIEQYIQQLKQNFIKNPLNSAQLMRNYFLRWKIYFLTSIVNKIQSQLSLQQEPYQQQQYQQQQQEQSLEQKNPHNKKRHNRHPNHPNLNRQQQLHHQDQIINEYASNKSLQSNINSLKDQKHRLKQYIQTKRTKQFFNICRENIANKNIKQVMNGFYQRNLKMKVIQALWQNKQQTVIQENAQFLANNQNQEENMTALIFYRTNILAKSFFGLKKLMKCSKFSKITQNLLIKKSYQALKYETVKQRDNEIKLEKFLQRKRRQILFKCFNGIKSETSYSNQISSKIEGFKNKKQDQIIQLCFSALSLAWKKRLTKIKKIEILRTVNSVKIFLFNLQDNISDKIEQQDLYLKASYIVLYNKNCQFISNLKKQYVKFLNIKKLSIQSTKLQINRTYKQAHTMLSNWHKSYTHLKNYDLIEQKLKRVKQHEQKQKLLKIWHARLLQKFRRKRKDKLTNNHKIWLNKYYQKLCAIDQDVQDSGNQDLN